MLYAFSFFRTEARELTFKESTLLINFDKINTVNKYSLKNIVVEELSLGEFLSYKVLKNSCRPLDELLAKIKNEADDFPEQDKVLAPLVSVCSQGVIGLVDLKIGQSQK